MNVCYLARKRKNDFKGRVLGTKSEGGGAGPEAEANGAVGSAGVECVATGHKDGATTGQEGRATENYFQALNKDVTVNKTNSIFVSLISFLFKCFAL